MHSCIRSKHHYISNQNSIRSVDQNIRDQKSTLVYTYIRDLMQDQNTNNSNTNPIEMFKTPTDFTLSKFKKVISVLNRDQSRPIPPRTALSSVVLILVSSRSDSDAIKASEERRIWSYGDRSGAAVMDLELRLSEP